MQDEKKAAKAEQQVVPAEQPQTFASLALSQSQPLHAVAAARVLLSLDDASLMTPSEFIAACERALNLSIN